MNSAAKSAAFAFGCIIVSTLYNTILLLQYAHLNQLELSQLKRRRTIFNCTLSLLVLLSITTDILLYTIEGWTVRENAITDTSLFGVLSIVYVYVVFKLFNSLCKIQLTVGSLEKEKDDILHQFYIFEIVYITRTLFNLMAVLMWDSNVWFGIQVIFACIVIPVWDITPIFFILYSHCRLFKMMENSNHLQSTVSFVSLATSIDEELGRFTPNK